MSKEAVVKSRKSLCLRKHPAKVSWKGQLRSSVEIEAEPAAVVVEPVDVEANAPADTVALAAVKALVSATGRPTYVAAVVVTSNASTHTHELPELALFVPVTSIARV